MKPDVIMSLGKTFRQSFDTQNIEIAGWFARHMYKSVHMMQSKLKSLDCIIEVHDARIPFSGRNYSFRSLLTAIKPHMLVLNKCDLADESFFSTISKYHTDRGTSKVFFTDAKNDSNHQIRKIVPAIEELIRSSDRYNRQELGEYSVMIIGVPNVGKSSLINKLRNTHLTKGRATVIGSSPGVTKTVLERIKICEDPPIFLLDTPGISAPRLPNSETGLRLGMCAILRDDLIGVDLLADYILYWMNKHNNFSYVEYLGIDEPSDNITEVQLKGALKNEKTRIAFNRLAGKKVMMPNLQWTSAQLIKGFRLGAFGKCILDDDKF